MEQTSRIIRVMVNAPAHLLAETMAEQVAKEFDAEAVELLLADYQLSDLLPVLRDAQPVPLPTGAAGQCFTTQQPLRASGDHGATALYLPVSVHGERLGVLCVELGADARVDEIVEADLVAVADTLAQLLLAADSATDRYRRIRRTRRLTLAAEMQWELLPGRCYSAPSLDFAGQLEPAYAIRGDNFDWAADTATFTITVTNGMGEGVHAAMLTSLAISALRNARRAGLGLADQASLADQALYSEYRGESYLSTLLLRLETATGVITVVDAGSPLILRTNGDRAEILKLEQQQPLGRYEGTDYVEQRFQLDPGDRLIAVSDGVSEFLVAPDTRYADRALKQVLRRASVMTPLDSVRTIISDLLTHHGSRPLDDDAVVTCLDWHGPS